jgi:hypothetical protein
MHSALTPFVRLFCIAGAVVAGIGLVSAPGARAATQPVFQYVFPDSSSDIVANPTVTDRSAAGNHGMVSGSGLTGNGLSTNVPAGMPGRSVDFTGAGDHTIRTNSTRLLTTTAVANAGGFTYDVWIFPTALPAGTSLFKIIDYSGTEALSVTSTGAIRANLNSVATEAAVSAPVTLNEWHHLVVQFDTKGNQPTPDPVRTPELQVSGELSLTVDGITTISITGNRKGGYGDLLNRVIGIGGHPTSTGERYIGLIYNPTVSLGIVPEPASLGVLAVGILGLLVRRRTT